VISATDIPTNDAIQWHGTRYGLMPSLSEEAERIVRQGEVAIPALMHALRDPDRFVTAHVLLTRITGVQHESFPSWNGLEISLESNGEVEFAADQRERLARRWQRWYSVEPPPDALADEDH